MSPPLGALRPTRWGDRVGSSLPASGDGLGRVWLAVGLRRTLFSCTEVGAGAFSRPQPQSLCPHHGLLEFHDFNFGSILCCKEEHFLDVCSVLGVSPCPMPRDPAALGGPMSQLGLVQVSERQVALSGITEPGRGWQGRGCSDRSGHGCGASPGVHRPAQGCGGQDGAETALEGSWLSLVHE